MSALITAHDLHKDYLLGEFTVKALGGVDLVVESGEFLYIMGPSGSGKTTLLNVLGGIDRPTKGQVAYPILDESDITKLKERALCSFRRQHLSYVFQFYSLIPSLTAKENVELMIELVKTKGQRVEEVALQALAAVGLEERKDNFPSQLSGGERQRVAIARAFAKSPLVMFVDEPTGQLDTESGRMVVEVLKEINQKHGKTVVLVTHDQELTDLADRVIHLRSGKIVDEEAI
ncbi:MAG: ABC transporter ATP-binding protein [Candidatus Hodarchaeales archaeon]|jgi:putative ABC transport system ATP-binding protein